MEVANYLFHSFKVMEEVEEVKFVPKLVKKVMEAVVVVEVVELFMNLLKEVVVVEEVVQIIKLVVVEVVVAVEVLVTIFGYFHLLISIGLIYFVIIFQRKLELMYY